MLKKTFLSVVQDISSGRFLPLLVAMLLYLGLGPTLGMLVRMKFLVDLLFAIILFAGIYAVSRDKHQMRLALGLALPAFVSTWLSLLFTSNWLWITQAVFGILFFGYTISLMGRYIFSAQQVSRDVVYAAIITYLMIGLLWAYVYGVIAILAPGSFDVSRADIKSVDFIFTYYSFVTLTTLGFGDIVPLTGPAYSLVILEALVGQIYLTVLVARLVGLHIAHSQRNGP